MIFEDLIKNQMEKEIGMIEKILKLFLKDGVKTVTMDDIAKELGMSKKTLYLKYKNKDELLEEVLAFGMEKAITRMRNLDDKVENAIERMFARDEEFENASRTNDSIMLRQLVKYYPHIFNAHMLLFSEKLSEMLMHNIARGRKQGLYREDFDSDIYSKMFFQLMMTYDISPYLNRDKVSRTYYHKEALLLYMHAITNEEGKKHLERFKNSKPD